MHLLRCFQLSRWMGADVYPVPPQTSVTQGWVVSQDINPTTKAWFTQPQTMGQWRLDPSNPSKSNNRSTGHLAVCEVPPGGRQHHKIRWSLLCHNSGSPRGRELVCRCFPWVRKLFTSTNYYLCKWSIFLSMSRVYKATKLTRLGPDPQILEDPGQRSLQDEGSVSIQFNMPGS